MQKLHLFHDIDKSILELLFLLFLFWKEAGNAFVENKVNN